MIKHIAESILKPSTPVKPTPTGELLADISLTHLIL